MDTLISNPTIDRLPPEIISQILSIDNGCSIRDICRLCKSGSPSVVSVITIAVQEVKIDLSNANQLQHKPSSQDNLYLSSDYLRSFFGAFKNIVKFHSSRFPITFEYEMHHLKELNLDGRAGEIVNFVTTNIAKLPSIQILNINFKGEDASWRSTSMHPSLPGRIFGQLKRCLTSIHEVSIFRAPIDIVHEVDYDFSSFISLSKLSLPLGWSMNPKVATPIYPDSITHLDIRCSSSNLNLLPKSITKLKLYLMESEVIEDKPTPVQYRLPIHLRYLYLKLHQSVVSIEIWPMIPKSLKELQIGGASAYIPSCFDNLLPHLPVDQAATEGYCDDNRLPPLLEKFTIDGRSACIEPSESLLSKLPRTITYISEMVKHQYVEGTSHLLHNIRNLHLQFMYPVSPDIISPFKHIVRLSMMAFVTTPTMASTLPRDLKELFIRVNDITAVRKLPKELITLSIHGSSMFAPALPRSLKTFLFRFRGYDNAERATSKKAKKCLLVDEKNFVELPPSLTALTMSNVEFPQNINLAKIPKSVVTLSLFSLKRLSHRMLCNVCKTSITELRIDAERIESTSHSLLMTVSSIPQTLNLPLKLVLIDGIAWDFPDFDNLQTTVEAVIGLGFGTHYTRYVVEQERRSYQNEHDRFASSSSGTSDDDEFYGSVMPL